VTDSGGKAFVTFDPTDTSHGIIGVPTTTPKPPARFIRQHGERPSQRKSDAAAHNGDLPPWREQCRADGASRSSRCGPDASRRL
jgi:hypothetical protein